MLACSGFLVWPHNYNLCFTERLQNISKIARSVLKYKVGLIEFNEMKAVDVISYIN